MVIIPDKVRELAALSERPTIDYKVEDYDWAIGTRANATMAKDVLAKANLLKPGDEPAYILIGVENDGTIIGITTKHLDDADVQGKLRPFFVRVPQVLYGEVTVDGLSVGVYVIRPSGERPYYSVREVTDDKGKVILPKNIALIRSGSATAVASPDEIVRWAREDDPVQRELVHHDLLEARAKSTPHGRIDYHVMNQSQDFEATVDVHNTGRSGFFIEAVDWQIEWTDEFHSRGRGLPGEPLPDGYVPPRGQVARFSNALLPPGDRHRFDFSFTREEALAHFRVAALEIQGFSPRWCRARLVVHCRTDLDGTGALGAVIGFD